MTWLELKIPPVMVTLLFVVTTYAIRHVQWAPYPDWSFKAPIGILIGLVGVVIILLGVWQFRRAKTTVNPTAIDTASSLVNRGIFAHTRNPMYLGMLLILFGNVIYVSDWLAFLCLPAFVCYMNRFQLQPEERMMHTLFGSAYQDYQDKVRRWF